MGYKQDFRRTFLPPLSTVGSFTVYLHSHSLSHNHTHTVRKTAITKRGAGEGSRDLPSRTMRTVLG